MPHLKEVYERYHPRGFELISICLDENENRARAVDILRRIGVPWQTAFEHWGATRLRERFGFTFVPVYFLLDRGGRLMTTDLYERNALENELRRSFDLPALGAGH